MNRIFKILLLLFVYLLAQATAQSKSAAAHDRLVAHLFTNYNSQVRPMGRSNKTLMVDVNVEMQHFDIRQNDGAFQFLGVLNVRWSDEKLTWNPLEYNNLTKIAINQRLLWVPDLEFYNNAPDKLLRMHRNGGIVLSANGSLLWSDAIEVVVFCTTNILQWPHEHHVCNLTLGSWTHHGNEIDFRIDYGEPLQVNNETTMNLMYNLVSYHAERIATHYEGIEEEYILISYFIEVVRADDGEAVILRVPALVVILLTLFALLMEPRQGQKIWLYGLCLLLITFQLIIMVGKTKQFAGATPLIVTFYSCCFVMVTTAIVLSVFCLWLTHNPCASHALPRRISSFLKNPFLNFLLPLRNKRVNGSSIEYENADLSGQVEDVRSNDCSTLLSGGEDFGERIYLARVVERIFLIAYSFIFLILLSVCYV